MSDENRTFNVLFLCTGSSARSILSEALLNKRGQGKFRAFSAGSRPAGRVNPYALKLLQKMGYSTLFLSPPLRSLEQLVLQQRLAEIGRS